MSKPQIIAFFIIVLFGFIFAIFGLMVKRGKGKGGAKRNSGK